MKETIKDAENIEATIPLLEEHLESLKKLGETLDNETIKVFIAETKHMIAQCKNDSARIRNNN